MEKRYYQIGGRIAVALLLGATALAVAFVAPFVVESVGTTSKREVVAPRIAIAVYLAFCQFWVSPRPSSGFLAKLPTLIALMTPVLVVAHNYIPVLAYAFVGCVVGAVIAHVVTATPGRVVPIAVSFKRSRRHLLASFILLAAVAALIVLGVIPSVAANTKTGLNAGAARIFLGITAGFDLLAATLLAFALWRRRENKGFSKGTLGFAAFVGLFLAILYALSSGVAQHGWGIAATLLVVCAVLALVTTVLMIITSITLDRAPLCT